MSNFRVYSGGPRLYWPLVLRPPAPNAVEAVSRILCFLELGGERIAHQAIPAIFLQARFFMPFRLASADNQGVAGARQRHIEKAVMFLLVCVAHGLPGQGERARVVFTGERP